MFYLGLCIKYMMYNNILCTAHANASNEHDE